MANADCHFLAVLTALIQSILEGRTDCPISGVFGAGKTRAAAAMIAGLLVMDSTLKVIVVTKENAAAHAFAKHIESLQLPPSLEEKFGRLVGTTELEKGPASRTKLDVLPNEARCPGGRPSVSTNYITIKANVFCIEMTTVHVIWKHRIKLAVSQRVPLW